MAWHGEYVWSLANWRSHSCKGSTLYTVKLTCNWMPVYMTAHEKHPGARFWTQSKIKILPERCCTHSQCVEFLCTKNVIVSYFFFFFWTILVDCLNGASFSTLGSTNVSITRPFSSIYFFQFFFPSFVSDKNNPAANNRTHSHLLTA